MRNVAGNISPEPLDIYTPEERLVKAFEQVDDYYKIVELSDVIDTAYEKFQLIKEEDEKYGIFFNNLGKDDKVDDSHQNSGAFIIVSYKLFKDASSKKNI